MKGSRNKIVIPSVPEPIDESLEKMMVGYLGHEMAHTVLSNFTIAEEFVKKHCGYEGLLNVVEDALIEKRAMERWPGVRRNLDMMFQQIRGRIAELIEKRKPFDRFCTAVYLKLSHHNDMMGLEQEVVGYEDLLACFPQIHNTREAADFTEAILQRWLQKNLPQQQPQSQPGESQADKDSQMQPGASENADDAQPPADQEGSSSASSTGKGAPESGDAQENSPETDPNDSPQDSPRPDDRDSGQFSGSHAEVKGDSGIQQNSEQITTSSQSGSLINDVLAEAIAEKVSALDGSRQYRPFTKQFDHIDVVPNADDAEVKTLLESDKDTVRRLRRGLTNALRSAEKRWWREDQIRGQLSPRRLYRLCTDRSELDVFRKRSMVQGQSTAVCVVLDASGSMSTRKMDVARRAMRVLLESLNDLKIPVEAFTFTTGNRCDINQIMQQSGMDAYQLRERYGRISNLEIGMVKQFEEPIKNAFSRLPNVRGSGLFRANTARRSNEYRCIAYRGKTRTSQDHAGFNGWQGWL